MAEVVGGNTKTLHARVAEIAAWFPALAVLVAAGGTSMLSSSHMVAFPAWAQTGLDLYHGIRDQLMQTALGKVIDPKYADAAIMGVAALTMLSRKILGFMFSIGGFLLLAVVAWILLRKFA